MLIIHQSHAQEEKNTSIPKRIYTTKKLKEVPVIDGKITEKAWDIVPWSSDFVEKNPELEEFVEVIRATSDDIVRGGLCKTVVKAKERQLRKQGK